MFKGSFTALITPFKNNRLDRDAYTKLIHHQIDNGTNGLVPGGTTGESPTLSHAEHREIIKISVRESKNRIPVMAGTGSNSTEEAIDLTRFAEKAGAKAALIVTPYYNKPTQEGLFLHYQAIAEAVDIPQILYNVPGRTACDMLPETVGRLAKIKNIVGVKEATGKLERVKQIRDLVGDDFAIYTGDDATSREFCLLGGNGSITVSGNVAPKLVHQMLMAAINGESELAAEIDAKLTGLHNDLFIQSNPIPVKWAVAEMGLMGKGIRLPLTWLSPECEATVRQAMQQAGVITA
jgi:4-hydroxy-tetrahydrodipicolinate synthase